MTLRDEVFRLRHMLDHAREAVEICSARRRSDLDRDRLFNLALVRLVEIVGEAANKVSPELQAAHPEIPWREIVSMRNRIIHGYDSVDFDILWAVVRDDLPALIERLEAMLPE